MRILLAVDDSECSVAAIKAVTSQFMPQHTHVHVLHVDEWPKGLPPAVTFAEGAAAAQSVLGLHDQKRRSAAALIDAAAAELRAAGFTTAASIRDGDPRQVIVAAAEEWHADLIVLGSHGRRGLDRLVLGSVSDSVARHASCSVEIVRAAARVA